MADIKEKAKNTVKKAEKKAAETKKTAAAAAGKAKAAANTAAKTVKAKAVKAKVDAKEVKATVASRAKAAAPKAKKAASLEIIIQSPMGGNISAKDIAAKLPAGCDCVFVRVDQNKLWWIKREETGSVDIWD